ncbi:MAG TPA: hypothetical protein VIP77_17345 [Jiangellaceae bacterium]
MLAVIVVGVAGCAGEPERTAESAEQPTGSASGVAPTERPPADPSCASPCYGPAESTGTLADDVVTQVSGMAASVRTPGAFYVVSDVAGTSEIAAVRLDGTVIARIEVVGMDAANAEALAVGPCGPDPAATCVYVGDIGDHVGRDEVVVYRTPEPDLAAAATLTADAETLRLTYPDAPTDAEALIVDDTGRPLIVSKAPFDQTTRTTGVTRLYRGGVDGGELELLAEVELPEPPTPGFADLVGNVVTDASAATGRVLLRTYDEVLEFTAPDPGVDVAGFPAWPMRRVPSPAQLQSETVSLLPGGCGYATTSEPTGSIDAVSCSQE